MNEYRFPFGDSRYFPKELKCECCKKIKGKTSFIESRPDYDDYYLPPLKLKRICKQCLKKRELIRTYHNDYNIDWSYINNEVTRPSIIDWMQENIKK